MWILFAACDLAGAGHTDEVVGWRSIASRNRVGELSTDAARKLEVGERETSFQLSSLGRPVVPPG